MDENNFVPAEGDLVLRDDQAEFFCILDEVGKRRAHGSRVRLIDSGAFSILEAERLALAGADIFTSDKAGRPPADLLILNDAAKKSGTTLAFFLEGPIANEPGMTGFPMAALREGVREGLALYLSNKKIARSVADLTVLAEDARDGRGVIGYYHHGPLVLGLSELIRTGAWLHVAAVPESESETVPALLDIARAAEGGGLVIHLDSLFSDAAVEDLLDAGAYLLFRTPPFDYRSPYRKLEERAARRVLDPRAYYLYSEFMR